MPQVNPLSKTNILISKKANAHSLSARFVKPKQKHIADSFMFNSGVANNFPESRKIKRKDSAKENKA